MQSNALRIHLLDTSISTDNLGDEIIVRHARSQLLQEFPKAYFSTSSSHDGLGQRGRRLAAEADIVFLLGSNALSGRFRYKGGHLPIGIRDARAMAGKVVLYGVGSKGESSRMDHRQRWLWRHLLHPNVHHSVRDQLAQELVVACGHKAINTSCHTLWDLPDRLELLPGQRSTVVFSLTHYRPAIELDRSFVAWLKKRYSRIALWAQQVEDAKYLSEIGSIAEIEILAPNIEAYDRFLSQANIDVIGTRLHGGIHALHHGHRSIIMSVDHRAAFIGKETGLAVTRREAGPVALETLLNKKITVDLSPVKARRADFFSQFEGETKARSAELSASSP